MGAGVVAIIVGAAGVGLGVGAGVVVAVVGHIQAGPGGPFRGSGGRNPPGGKVLAQAISPESQENSS